MKDEGPMTASQALLLQTEENKIQEKEKKKKQHQKKIHIAMATAFMKGTRYKDTITCQVLH
jgi:hypothetical protein